MTMNEGKRTLIEEGTELKGTLTSSCPVVVLGRLEGQMTGPSVDVAETGVLSGRAKVKELRSRGELAGEFEADNVELSGRVHDKTIIRARSLEVKLQRSDGRLELMFGECELAVGDEPDKAAAVREATSGSARSAAKGSEVAASGGEVTAEADASQSARNGRRKRSDESESHAENA
jgi:cytoskeletal protein CcmA (bactofilin family)